MTASRVITAAVVRSLNAVDPRMTVPQLRVLVMVSNEHGLSVNAVARGLGVNASSASRTCERLVSSGLLHRDEHTSDRRKVVLSLSSSGRRLVDSVMKHRRDDLLGVVDHMDPSERELLAASLHAFNAAAQRVIEESGPADNPDLHLLAWLD